MGLIETELRDLTLLAKKIMNGEVDIDKAKTLIGVYNQTAKRENMMIQLAISSDKLTKDKSWKRLNNMNLITDNSSIDCCQSLEDEHCKCYLGDNDRVISREECLDSSGKEENKDDCISCPQFAITRRKILSDV